MGSQALACHGDDLAADVFHRWSRGLEFWVLKADYIPTDLGFQSGPIWFARGFAGAPGRIYLHGVDPFIRSVIVRTMVLGPMADGPCLCSRQNL